MSYNNLQVNYDGTIYQYSKEPKEGYTEHTNTKGTKSYRKFYNKGVDGVFTAIEKKEGPEFRNKAEEVNLTLSQGEEHFVLNFPVLGQSGDQLDEFTQSLATLLPKMNIGETYNINNWHMKKGDVIKGDVVRYSKKGMTVKNEAGEKIKSDITYEYVKGRGTAEEKHVEGDVPMLAWKEIAGKNRPTAGSKEKQLEYLYDLLSTQVDRVSSTTSGTSENSSPESTPKSEPKSMAPDDLPF